MCDYSPICYLIVPPKVINSKTMDTPDLRSMPMWPLNKFDISLVVSVLTEHCLIDKNISKENRTFASFSALCRAQVGSPRDWF